MKISVFGAVYPDSFAKNILVTLQAMGHEARPVRSRWLEIDGSRFLGKAFNHLRLAAPRIEEWTYRPVISEAADFRPDLLIVAGEQPPPAVIRDLRRQTGTMVVQWFPDALANFGRQYVLASDYDAFFFKEAYIVRFFREKLLKRAYLLHEACNPMWHRRVDLTEGDKARYQCDLTVAANLYWYRALMLEHFLEYDLKVWGTNAPRWLMSPVRERYQHHYVAEEEKARAFNAAKVVLNTMHYAEIEGFNARLFEAAGCGAFQITDWKPELSRCFEPEKEVVTFQSMGELKEKVRYYLDHAEERQIIADQGYARAHREHTYERRLTRLLDLTFGGRDDAE